MAPLCVPSPRCPAAIMTPRRLHPRLPIGRRTHRCYHECVEAYSFFRMFRIIYTYGLRIMSVSVGMGTSFFGPVIAT